MASLIPSEVQPVCARDSKMSVSFRLHFDVLYCDFRFVHDAATNTGAARRGLCVVLGHSGTCSGAPRQVNAMLRDEIPHARGPSVLVTHAPNH